MTYIGISPNEYWQMTWEDRDAILWSYNDKKKREVAAMKRK